MTTDKTVSKITTMETNKYEADPVQHLSSPSSPKHTHKDPGEMDHNNQMTVPIQLCQMTIWTL